jgi:hypothetical protein
MNFFAFSSMQLVKNYQVKKLSSHWEKDTMKLFAF